MAAARRGRTAAGSLTPRLAGEPWAWPASAAAIRCAFAGLDCQATGVRLQEISRPDACCLAPDGYCPSALVCSAEEGFDIEDGGTVDRFEVVDHDPVSRHGLDPHG